MGKRKRSTFFPKLDAVRRVAQGAYKTYKGWSKNKRRKIDTSSRNMARIRYSTKTKKIYKTRKSPQKVYQRGTQGVSNSMALLKYKWTMPEKLYAKFSNAEIYETINTGSLVTGTGGSERVQVVGTVATIYSGTDVVTLAGAQFTGLPATMPIASANMGIGAVAGAKVGKIFLQRFTCEYEFVNQTDAVTTLWIYNLVSNVTNAVALDPSTVWQTGITDQKGSTTATSHTFPGAKPTTVKNFNNTWNVIKETVVEMLPGKVHRHKYDFHINRLVDVEYFTQYGMVKGITNHTLLVAKGSPCDDTLTFGAPTNIALSPVKIIYTYKHKYVTRQLDIKPSSYYQLNNLPNISVGAVPTLYQMNDLAGTVSQVNQNTYVA